MKQKNYELKLRKGCENWPTKYREFFLDYLQYLKKEAINNKLDVNLVFHDLILSINSLDFVSQKTELNKIIEAWRGELEQLDDICVIGVGI